jgi:hypothetical protein
LKSTVFLTTFFFSLLACLHAGPITLAWNALEDGSAVGYRVYCGESSGSYTRVLDAGLTETATVDGLQPGKTYYFVVTAYDSLASESLPSEEVAALTPFSPLTVAFKNAINGAAINGPRDVSISANASSPDSKVLRVEFFDGDQKLGETSTPPYSLTWQKMPVGTHQLRAQAWDAAGRSATTSALTLKVVQLRTSSIQRRADGAMELVVEAAPGSTNKIFASSDLSNWTLVDVFVNTDGSTTVVDPAAAFADRRFYRVEAQ